MRALLAAGGISLFISLFATPAFIALFRSLNWGQFIRDDGPEAHHTKRGTPTMGGIVILFAAVAGYFTAKLINGESAIGFSSTGSFYDGRFGPDRFY